MDNEPNEPNVSQQNEENQAADAGQEQSTGNRSHAWCKTQEKAEEIARGIVPRSPFRRLFIGLALLFGAALILWHVWRMVNEPTNVSSALPQESHPLLQRYFI